MNKLGMNDDLQWEKIRSMLRYIFRNTNIKIMVCANVEYTEEEKVTILKQFHNSKPGGHLGVNKIIKRIQKQFRWKGMKHHVKNYVRNCTSCQVNKISNRHVKQPIAITSTSSKPFEKIFLDIVGPLPTTQRWLSAFKHFKELNIEFDCLLIVVEFFFSLPGSNAAVERVFSLMNSTWTKSRNKLDISTVETSLIIKTSFDNMSCCQFYESILANKTLLQKLHSSAKYQTT
ncbi:O-acetyl-ADP-ribose deacetylase 1-like [Aphis craccivora]|uniref:O-acetyl-ADP-ribose deacetylase 1-like n=1 Tax=Aphis craccivora TaxID=307492 RepID=A0A6G0XCB5_APHCR|nr:O-acetyl-ADP-ribose deacetylase 1-like [Aphis craccivora]